MEMKRQIRMLTGLTSAMALVSSAYVVGWTNGNTGHDLELVSNASAAGVVIAPIIPKLF